MPKSRHRKNHKQKVNQFKNRTNRTPNHREVPTFGPKETTLASPRAGIQLPGSETDLDRYAF